jgi:cytochrome c oxidase assembly protein subunit 15
METSLPRFRGLAVSGRTFRRIAIANVVMLIVVVASGTTTRLTGSGLGCEHWPGCAPGEFLPTSGFHSRIEFGNRIVGATTVFVALVTWIAALLLPRARRSTRWLAFGTFAGALGQAPLGAVTVHYGLNPWLVGMHFLLSMVVLTFGVLVLLEAFGLRGERVPASIGALGLLVGAAGATLLVTGMLATAAGPHSGSVAVPRVGSFQPAMWLHVRATAVFAVAFAIVLAWLFFRLRTSRHLRLALLVFGLLLAQMAIGEIQYRSRLPWGLVLVHVTLAAVVWGVLSAFVAMLWRPRERERTA